MAKNGAEITIPLEEEIEGDQDSTGDFVFVRAGASVPLKASNSTFDLQRPPSQPIAISQRHRLLFLAHPDGFFVARTDDVLVIAKEIKEKAKEIKEKGEGPSVEKASLVNVKVGRVSILAVSTDESTLAVAVDRNIFFYSTVSFLDKEQQPLFSCSLNDSCIVKDFKWQKNMEKSYVVLSNHGLLYHGTLEAELKNVMNNVDAVDWSPDGGFVAVARKSVVTILASNFKEVLNLSLLFESWPPIDSEHTVKVDSMRWLREDSVIVGCIQVNEDGEEESYLVQVIKSKGHNFSKASCNPVVYSFPDLFDGVWDILPTGCGPYLLANYLDYWEVVLASNRKAIDQHISLFKWSMEDHKREVVSLEFCSDKYTPKIEVAENGDDNIVLGFCVEKFSSNEKIKIQIDDNFKEIYPRCTLLCLTGEGKLNLFHAARITDGSDLSQASVTSGNNNNVGEKHTMVGLSEVSTTIPRLKDGIENTTSENRLNQINTGPSDAQKDTFECHTLSPRRKQAGNGSHTGLLAGQFGTGKQPKEVPASHGLDFTLSSDVTSGAEVLPDFVSKRVEAATLVGETAEAPAAMRASTISAGSGFYGSAGFEGAPLGSQSMGKLFGAAINPSSPPFSGPLIDESQEKIKLNNATRKPHFNKATQNKEYTQPFPSTGNAEMLPTFRRSQLSQEGSLPSQHLLEKIRAFRYPQKLDSEPEISKQFYNVKNMAQELDILLSFIERKGGFRDACTLFQGSSLLALENALGDISEMSQRCKRHLEERVTEIQQLQSKMLQVSARQEYMRGIVEQASNKKYWDIWNQQKLNPELEAKRQNILNANQNLTNQIIELERHFNILEINRFGGSGRTSVGHTPFQSGLVAARQRQSLQSVYNTLNSQLAAAEHLSECLSKQMSELHLDLVSTGHQSIAKELLDSIGLSDEITSMQSPVCKRPSHAPATPRGMLPSRSNAVQEHPRTKTSSVVKAFESETARRKRESLDRNWATFEPPKTTVKRTMQVQRYRVGADKTFRKAKEKFDSQMEAFSIQQKRMQDSHLKLATEARSNSGANLAKNIFSPPDILGSNSDLEAATEKTSKSPPLMTPSLSGVSSFPSGIKGPFRTGDMSSTEVTKVDYMSKPLVANNITSSRYSSSTISSPITPLNTRLIGDAKDPRGMNSNLTGAGTDGPSLLGHTKQLADSSKSVSSVANEGNIFSTVRAFASAGVNEKTTGSDKISMRSQVSEPILNMLSDAKVSVPTSSSSLSPFASPDMTFFKQSSTPVSTAPISLGKSLPHTKPAGVNNETISGSASITASNNQSLSSSSFVSTQSKNTVSQATPAPTLIPPKSSTVASFDSKSEASNQLATESTATSAPSILPISSSNSLYSKSQESSATTFISLSTATRTPAVTEPTLPVTPATVSPVHLDAQPAPSQSSASVEVKPQPTSSDSTANASSPSQPEVPSSMAQVSTTTGKDERLDASLSQGDEMEEEASSTPTLSLDSLGGFGLGTTPSTAPKSNPFGGSFLTSTSNTAGTPLSSTVPAGEPFRPPSFSLPSAQPVQTSQPASSGGLSSNLGRGFSGFGQPAHVGVGQQALGSVLGSFGQSRQLGSGIPGVGFPSSSGFGGGGFPPAANSGGFSPGGGFANAATGGGFTSAASAGGGFAAAAAKGGGFASLASGGGFAGATAGGGFGTATPPGGFAAAAAAGHVFGATGAGGGFASGGFGGFGSNQGGGFSGFGGNAAPTSGKPPAELLTQMRK